MGIYLLTHFVHFCMVGAPVRKRRQKGREENKEEEEEGMKKRRGGGIIALEIRKKHANCAPS